MNPFLDERFGDPCRECGYAWGAGEDPVALIGTAAATFASLAAGRDGGERSPGLAWDLTAYVCHAADNTRIWAERLVGAAHGARSISPYDEEALAVARGYEGIALDAALWSLGRAVGDWQAARALDGPGFVHPQQGDLSVADVERIVAHELHHHALDVRRIVQG